MKLVIASQGFTTNEIAENVEKLLNKPLNKVNVCIVNECPKYLKYNSNKRWLINELYNIQKFIGGNITFADFQLQTKEEIEDNIANADLVYFVGGQRHVLSKIFRETDTLNIILKYSDKKVYMGTSAGSMCLCRQIDSEKFWMERYATTLKNVRKNPELELVPFAIFPHYLREDHLNWTKEFLTDVLKDNTFPVYAIRDDQAIIYNNGNIQFIGGNPDIFGTI